MQHSALQLGVDLSAAYPAGKINVLDHGFVRVLSAAYPAGTGAEAGGRFLLRLSAAYPAGKARRRMP